MINKKSVDTKSMALLHLKRLQATDNSLTQEHTHRSGGGKEDTSTLLDTSGEWVKVMLNRDMLFRLRFD